jgi:hypothetical protein
MLDLKDLNVAAAASRGAFIELEHPVTGEPLLDAEGAPYGVDVLGEDSPEVRKVERKQADRRAEKLRRGNIEASLKQEALEIDRIERLTAATRGWHLPPLDGEPLDFNAQTAKRVYGSEALAWIADQVERGMRDRARFFSTGSTR